jgi:hypothetical protein
MKRWGLSEWVGMTGIFGVGMGIGGIYHCILCLDGKGFRSKLGRVNITRMKPGMEPSGDGLFVSDFG